MRMLAHFTERAQAAAAQSSCIKQEQQQQPLAAQASQSARACALEDLLLWLSTYR
jgi:hypothetical protein